MLMLRRFYEDAPVRLEKVLGQFFEGEYNLGLTFEQQIVGKSSVLDAVIHQPPMYLGVEAKVGSDLEDDQIERHLQTIGEHAPSSAGRFLLGLTKEAISKPKLEQLRERAKQARVVFSATTYSELLGFLRRECSEYERDLVAMVDDYEAYLEETDLLGVRNRKLPIVPCRTSFNENRKYGVYYEPSSRRSKAPYRFMGLYRNKSVAMIGEVEAILVADWNNDLLSLSAELGAVTEERVKLIEEVIETTGYYELRGDHARYYLFSDTIDVNVEKKSPGGLFGLRYLDLQEITGSAELSDETSLAELATMLRAASFT